MLLEDIISVNVNPINFEQKLNNISINIGGERGPGKKGWGGGS